MLLLVYFVAFLIVICGDHTGMSFTKGVDVFLDKALYGNWIVLWILVSFFGLALIISMVASTRRSSLDDGGWGPGAFVLVTFVLAVAQAIGWALNYGMAHFFAPSGVTNTGGFWTLVAFTALGCLGSFSSTMPLVVRR